MKMKRLLASVLALLLVVSLLPISALAMNDNPVGGITEVPSDEGMGKNEGTVTRNEGTIMDNGTVNGGVSSGTVIGNVGTVTNNYGTVKQNVQLSTLDPNGDQIKKGEIARNYGVVEYNFCIVETNEAYGLVGVRDTEGEPVVKQRTGNFGTVNTNNGTITTNGKTVNTNGQNGTILVNEGAIGTNSGTVKTNAEGGTVKTNAEGGIIETNNGTVITNNVGGTVKTNDEGGTVGQKHENGNAVAGTGNNGTIETNSGTVISNNKGGTVKTNAATGTIEVNDGTVGIVDRYEPTPDGWGKPIPEDGTGNFGNIDINNGSLSVNHEDATVGINNGDIELNYGDIDTNNDYVAWNYGTVVTNTIDGAVWNETTLDQNGENVTGTVTNNYGTMNTNTGKVDEDGRSIYKTKYGVQVQNTDGGAGTQLLQAVKNEIVKLADKFKRDGYELVGYNDITLEPESPEEGGDGPVGYAWNNNPSAQELSATDFQATRPSILSLIWKAIVKPAAPSGDPEPKTVQNNIPTSLSAGKVTVGAYVRVGNLLFRIIEVGDDSIRVATVPKLSEKSLSDMLGFLKQHLSAAQIAKIDGEPKLLEQELVTQFFGDTIDHISFYAAADLFE